MGGAGCGEGHARSSGCHRGGSEAGAKGHGSGNREAGASRPDSGGRQDHPCTSPSDHRVCGSCSCHICRTSTSCDRGHCTNLCCAYACHHHHGGTNHHYGSTHHHHGCALHHRIPCIRHVHIRGTSCRDHRSNHRWNHLRCCTDNPLSELVITNSSIHREFCAPLTDR